MPNAKTERKFAFSAANSQPPRPLTRGNIDAIQPVIFSTVISYTCWRGKGIRTGDTLVFRATILLRIDWLSGLIGALLWRLGAAEARFGFLPCRRLPGRG